MRRLALVLLTCLAGAGARAEEALPPSDPGPAPTLDEVLRSVDRHLPKLLAEAANVDVARGARLGATGVFDPTLSGTAFYETGPYPSQGGSVMLTQDTPLYGLRAEAGWRLGDGTFASYDKRKTLKRGEVGAGLVLPLLKGGLTDADRTAVRVTDAGLAQAQADFSAARVMARRDGRAAFAKWLAAGEQLALFEAQLDLARRAYSGVEAAVRTGDRPERDRLDARRVVVEREGNVIEGRQYLLSAALKLGLYLRGPDGEPIQLPVALRPPPLPERAEVLGTEAELLAEAMASRPELDSFDAQLSAAQATLRLARVDVLPKLDLKAKVRQDLAGLEDDKTDPLEVKLGLGLEVPLALRGGRGKLISAKAKLDAVEAKRRWLADRVRVDVRRAVAALDAAQRRAILAAEDVELARALEDATRAAFREGEVDVFSLYLREQSTAKAVLSSVKARLALFLAEADLRAAIGRP